MISASSPKEKICADALISLAHHANNIAHNPSQSIDDKMKTLQWIYKNIPKINRLLIEIKTKQIGTP